MEKNELSLQAEQALKEIVNLIWGFEIKITSKQNEKGIVLNLEPQNKQQTAVLIGLKGRNIESLRTLMRAWGAVRNVRVSIAPLIKK